MTQPPLPALCDQVLSLEKDRGSFRDRGSNMGKTLLFGPVVTTQNGDLAIQVTPSLSSSSSPPLLPLFFSHPNLLCLSSDCLLSTHCRTTDPPLQTSMQPKSPPREIGPLVPPPRARGWLLGLSLEGSIPTMQSLTSNLIMRLWISSRPCRRRQQRGRRPQRRLLLKLHQRAGKGRFKCDLRAIQQCNLTQQSSNNNCGTSQQKVAVHVSSLLCFLEFRQNILDSCIELLPQFRPVA
jgi:hypothetical protein